MKQIRLKHWAIVIGRCQDCPCHNTQEGTCNLLKSKGRYWHDLNPNCQLEDYVEANDEKSNL